MTGTGTSHRGLSLLAHLAVQGKYTLFMALIEKGVYFLLFASLARTLDAQAYGAVVATFAFVNILNAFFELGFGAYIQREVSAGAGGTDTVVGTVLLFKAAASIAFGGAVWLYFLVFGMPFNADAAIIALLVYLTGFGSVLAKVLYGKGLFRASFTALAKSRVIVPLGLGAAFLSGAPPTVILLSLLAAVTSQTVLLFVTVQRTGSAIRWRFDRALLGRILRSSLPMGTGVFFVWVYDKMDVLLIQHLITTDAVAMYATAYSLYKFPHIAAGMLLTPMYTELSSRFGNEGKVRLHDILPTAGLLLAMSILCAALLSLMPEFLLSLAYGERYATSASLLRPLCIALPALFLNNLTGVMLNAVRRERTAMLSALWALIANIGLNILLLPLIGIMGAVVATIAAEYLIVIIQAAALRRSSIIVTGSTV